MRALRRVARALRRPLQTIRGRLTLWYVALLAITLLGFSAFLYLSLARTLRAEGDRLLLAAAEQTIAMLEVVDGQPHLPDTPEALPPGMVVVLYDATGQEVLANSPRRPLTTLAAALPRPGPAQVTFATVRLADGEPWRVLSAPVVEDGRPVGVLQVARSERDADVTLRQLVLLMAVAVPATLLLAIAGSLFLAGRALDPIDRVTRTAGQISAEHLSRRLGFRGNDEVGHLAATFDRMLDRLEAAFQRERRFTADTSHEFRTPLAMLVSQIDVGLERRRSTAEYERILRSVRDDATRMSQLLAELLTLARADAGRDELAREPVDLEDLADQVAATMQSLARQRGITLERVRQGAAVVEADQTRLTQLLVNLVENALKYTEAGGRVDVVTEAASGWAVLAVVDTGIGIPQEHLPHIFERFYRVDKARSRAAGGAGLGLAISRWVAEAHGGTIDVESEPGRGTTFTVRLPLAPGTGARGSPAVPVHLLQAGGGRIGPEPGPARPPV